MLQLISIIFILLTNVLCRAVETLDKPFHREGRSDSFLKDVYDILVKQKVEMIALQKNGTDIWTKLENYKSQMDKQNSMISKLETKNKIQNQELQVLKKLKTRMKKKIQNIMQEMNQLKKRQKTVAFTVRLIPGTTVGSNTILPFNRVYTNEGRGYRVSDKKFHCPRSGLYLFSLSVETSSSRLDVHMMINGRENGELLKGTYGNAWGTGSVSIVTRLKHGDTVWVLCKQRVTLGQISFFSGVLISY